MDPSRTLYTRQQIKDLTGIDDATLNYWSRESLLVPSEGGSGKGSHRKFDAKQVSLAALLGELQGYGVTIGRLRRFAELVQTGYRLSSTTDLHPFHWDDAADLRDDLERFRGGQTVEVRLSRNDFEYTPAASEQDIVDQHAWNPDYATAEQVLAFAETLPPGSLAPLRIAYIIHSEMYDWGGGADWSILLWQGTDGEWLYNDAPEPGDSPDFPEGQRSGILLGVGAIIRDTWGIDLAERRRRREIQRLAYVLRKDPSAVFHSKFPEDIVAEARRIAATDAENAERSASVQQNRRGLEEEAAQ